MRISLLTVVMFTGCARPNPSFEVESTSAAGTTTPSATTGPTSGPTGTGGGPSSASTTGGSTGGVTTSDTTEGVETGKGSSSSSSSSSSTSSPSSSSGLSSDSGEPGNQLVIEGLGSFATACVDPDCGAREACQRVTGKDCLWVPYDALNLNVGSYVSPEYKEKPQEFSFGLYAITNDFGNISSCLELEAAKALLVSYGVAVDHQWCGLGWWYLENG